MRIVRLSVMLAAAALLLSACSGPTSDRATPEASTSVPSAQHQRSVLLALYDETKTNSDVSSWKRSDQPYPEACGLPGGSEGAHYDITEFGAAVADSEGAVRRVGRFLHDRGLTVEYTTETGNGITQYQVLATGGGVSSISFTADSTKTTLFGVSACGTGKEGDLAGT